MEYNTLLLYILLSPRMNLRSEFPIFMCYGNTQNMNSGQANRGSKWKRFLLMTMTPRYVSVQVVICIIREAIDYSMQPKKTMHLPPPQPPNPTPKMRDLQYKAGSFSPKQYIARQFEFITPTG